LWGSLREHGMIVGAVGAVGSLSRINLAMSTMRASSARKMNMNAGAAAMMARIRTRRAVANLHRAEFTARMRASSISNGNQSVDTYA